nr:hypothetical protein CFP56_31895 [Quercus suber]
MESRIDEEPQILQPGPSDGSLLMRQRHHRLEDIWNGEDPGPLTCRGCTKEMANIQMRDNRVIDIIKLLRLEGLFRAHSKETGEMARDHDYYQWYRPVTRKQLRTQPCSAHPI